MNIKSLNHCGLLVSDLEKSRWFYGTVLGMDEVPRPDTFQFAGAWFRSGSCEVHLLLFNDPATALGFPDPEIVERPAFATHMAFEVQDFEQMMVTLEQHGIAIHGGPLARGDGMMQVFIHDPDGYMLEFYSWVDGSERDAPARLPVD